MVGDEHRDLAAAHQLLDVLGLRLGERGRAAVGRVEGTGLDLGEVGRAAGRSRAAPETPVVAVEVDAEEEAAVGGHLQGAGAVGGVDPVDEAAVLAHVGVAGSAEDGDGAASVEGAQVDELAVGAREVEAVGVDHRDHDHAALLQQLGGALVLAVALGQVDGELHRVLARGPLAGVVQTHQHEGRLAGVGALDALADLDGLDGATVEGGVVELEHLDVLGEPLGEVGHVGVVVLERAVAVATGRQRAALDRVGVGLVALPDLQRPGDEVGDLDVVGQARGQQQRTVGRRVQDDLDVVVAGVLGEVQTQLGQHHLVGAGGGVDLDQLGPEDVGGGGRGGLGPDRRERGEGEGGQRGGRREGGAAGAGSAVHRRAPGVSRVRGWRVGDVNAGSAVRSRT